MGIMASPHIPSNSKFYYIRVVVPKELGTTIGKSELRLHIRIKQSLVLSLFLKAPRPKLNLRKAKFGVLLGTFALPLYWG